MIADAHSKFLGAVIGSAIGDAVGEMAFRFMERERLLEEIENTDTLRYTDDTVMVLAVAESLISVGDIDAQLLGNTMREHYHKEPWRGFGEGTRHIFSLVESEGIGYLEAAARLHGGAGSYGNGAAMRILPVGLFFRESGSLYDKAKQCAEITHAHPIAIDAAAVLASTQAKMLALNYQRPFSPEAILEYLLSITKTDEIRNKLVAIAELLRGEISDEDAVSGLGLSIAAHESLPFALYSFLRYPHTFMECVLCAVCHGGDRDTMGAMAGAIAGAYLGIEGIPAAWVKKLENNQHIEAVARELAARC